MVSESRNNEATNNAAEDEVTLVVASLVAPSEQEPCDQDENGGGGTPAIKESAISQNGLDSEFLSITLYEEEYCDQIMIYETCDDPDITFHKDVSTLDLEKVPSVNSNPESNQQQIQAMACVMGEHERNDLPVNISYRPSGVDKCGDISQRSDTKPRGKQLATSFAGSVFACGEEKPFELKVPYMCGSTQNNDDEEYCEETKASTLVNIASNVYIIEELKVKEANKHQSEAFKIQTHEEDKGENQNISGELFDCLKHIDIIVPDAVDTDVDDDGHSESSNDTFNDSDQR